MSIDSFIATCSNPALYMHKEQLPFELLPDK